MEKNKISVFQFMLLLFISRIFSALTYYPAMGKSVSGTAVLIGNLIGTAALLLLFWPLWIMARRFPGCSLVMNVQAGFGSAGKASGILYYLFFLVLAANTLAHFQFFMTNAVFTQANIWVIILPVLLVAAYAAYVGVEGLARSSALIFVCFLFALGFILLSSISKIEWTNLLPIANNAVKEITISAFAAVSRCAELLLAYFLLPYIKGQVKKGVWGFLGMNLAAQELMAFFLLAVLGVYAQSQTFPFFSLAAISEISIFQRMDALYMSVWVLVAFLRLALLFFIGTDILQLTLPHKDGKTPNRLACLVITAAATLGLAIPACYSVQLLNFSYMVLYTGGAVLILGGVLPTGLLIWLLIRQKKRKAETDR